MKKNHPQVSQQQQQQQLDDNKRPRTRTQTETHRMFPVVMPGSHGKIGETNATLPEKPVSSSSSRSAAAFASSPASTRPAGDSTTYVRVDRAPRMLSPSSVYVPSSLCHQHRLYQQRRFRMIRAATPRHSSTTAWPTLAMTRNNAAKASPGWHPSPPRRALPPRGQHDLLRL